MIILSEGATGQRYPHQISGKPELMRFSHRDIDFAYDPNTLGLAVVQGSDTDEVLQDFARASKPVFPLEVPKVPGSICLDITRVCNLRCAYCFVGADDLRGKEKNLSLEDTIEGLALILPRMARQGDARNQKLEISFFGGEPLTRFDYIQKVVTFVLGFVPMQVRFHVTTNGTLLTPEIVRFLELHNFTAIVSVDGPEAAHNELRVKADGSGSYEDMMRGLELLRTYAPSVLRSTTLRSTFTPATAKSHSLSERIAHLNDLVDAGFGDGVSVEPAFIGEYACHDMSTVRNESVDFSDPVVREFWEKQYSDASDLWLERLAEGKSVYFHHYNAIMRRMHNGLAHCSECGAGKGYFTIAPGGEIYACHHEGGTLIGHINRGGVDSELAAVWQDNRYYSRLKCPDCPIRNVCGGGCREYSVAAGLGASMPVPGECELKFLLFKNSAWLLSQLCADDDLMEKAQRYIGLPKQSHACSNTKR